MSSLLQMLAQTTTPATQPGGSAPGWAQLVKSPMFLIFGLLIVFWFFIMRSKRNQEKQRQDMLSALKRGDRVQTIGGMLGSVVEAREDEVLVKVDESSNTKIWFVRAAIHRVTTPEKTDKQEKK